MDPIYLAVLAGAAGLGFAVFLVRYVLRQDEGTQRMRDISAAIKEGALAFLSREYRILGIFIILLAIVFGAIPSLGWWVALSVVFGALCSGLAGFIGMNMAIRSNARTAAAAQTSLNQGLRVAFRSGAVMGICVVGIGNHGVPRCL